MMDIREITHDREAFTRWFERLDEKSKIMLQRSVDEAPRVGPIPGPQMHAYNSKADITGFGGAGGGGKSALICILSIAKHRRTVIFRADAKQMSAMIDDLVLFLGTDKGLNRQDKLFKFTFGKDNLGRPIERMVEWGGLMAPGEKMKWRGRPHDLMCVDEATEISLENIRFVSSWVRTVTEGQRVRQLYTFNPPGVVTDDMVETGVDGRWVIDYFAPWIDEQHINPASPGELRWYITNDHGEEVETQSNRPHELHINGKVFVTEPKSRTFIPSLVTDNPYLTGTNYEKQLLSLPEPLRSQMLGNFTSQYRDQENQILPTKWVDAAMERFDPDVTRGTMTAVGADVARGGKDTAVLARRYGMKFAPIIRKAGVDVSDGSKMVAFILEHVRDGAVICLDALAVGTSPKDILMGMGVPHIGVIGTHVKNLPRIDSQYEMYNRRTWLYWLLRKALDPATGMNLALPPDKRLHRQLCAPIWTVTGKKIQMEPKMSVKKRLGFSPDDADAVAASMANLPNEQFVGSEKLLNVRKSNVFSAMANALAQNRAFDKPQSWMSM